MYDFWVRPVIEWKLGCEHGDDAVTRSQIVNALKFEPIEVTLIADAALFITIIVFLIIICNTFLMITKKFQDCAIRPIWVGPLCIIIAMEVLSSIFLLMLTGASQDSFKARMKAFSKFSVLNECSDSYTTIDYETIEAKMNDSTRMIRLAYTCAVVFLLITLCVMIYIAWGLLKVRGEMKNQMVERRIVYKRERLEEQV